MSEGYRNRTRNAVLLKDDVGKAKPSYYDLPHAAHAYGRSEPADMEGAREVTMHWAAHVPRAKQGTNCQDFRKLNREAAKCGVTNAAHLAQWRSTGVDIKLIPPAPAGCVPKVIPSDVIKSFAYGQKSRPSTPIHHVLGGQYAVESEEALEHQYRMLEEEQAYCAKTRIKLTKGAKDRINFARSMRNTVEVPKEPFKLSKFKKVSSRLQLAPLSGSSSMPNLRSAASIDNIDSQNQETLLME
eukprot:TRINITY_DN3365_c0_g1_i2.p1 TRINITY_DN3365_c0_g1~~TRINITY_DN3365_c0_g1_i2.p1  ORF type:complete len:274 (+),score=54.77 TRINITY_DN3365_c0_g1_i2:98-823(+)